MFECLLSVLLLPLELLNDNERDIINGEYFSLSKEDREKINDIIFSDDKEKT